MKSFILKTANYIFQRFNLHLKGNGQFQKEKTYVSFLENILTSAQRTKNTDNHAVVEFVVFSKDRAIQLHALLGSAFFNLSDYVKFHVLYRASNSEQEQSYQDVIHLYSGKDINFIKENNFREDLILILEDIKSSKLIFLVDDILFIEKLDIHDFSILDTKLYVPSLRLGDHLNFSYTYQKEQPLPTSLTELGKDKITWNWQEGQLDWNYPLSVDGHLFNVEEIRAMFPFLKFKAPNSFEEALQQFLPLYVRRKGIAYRKAKILNIPCNKVQEENNNIAEEVNVDFLLSKWQNGYQIDFLKLQNVTNRSAHQFFPFEYIKRTK